jgi:lactam utilization protein B
LNSDPGQSFGALSIGNDAAMLGIATDRAGERHGLAREVHAGRTDQANGNLA